MPRRKLYRSRNDMICGVCQGLANWLGMEVTVVRILFLVALFFAGSSIWIYILLAIIIPLEPTRDSHNDYYDDDYRKTEYGSEYRREYKTQQRDDLAQKIKDTVNYVVDEVSTEIKHAFSDEKKQDRNRDNSTSSRSSNSDSEEYIRAEVDRLKRKAAAEKSNTFRGSGSSTTSEEIRNRQKESEWDSRLND